MPGRQLGKYLNGLRRVAQILMGARQLIVDAVVVRRVRIFFQQLFVQRNRFGHGFGRRLGGALGIGHAHLKVGKATLGFLARQPIRLQFQQLAVVVDGALRVAGNRL